MIITKNKSMLENLPGGMPQIEMDDLEYFHNKILKSFGIPVSYFGLEVEFNIKHFDDAMSVIK